MGISSINLFCFHTLNTKLLEIRTRFHPNDWFIEAFVVIVFIIKPRCSAKTFFSCFISNYDKIKVRKVLIQLKDKKQELTPFYTKIKGITVNQMLYHSMSLDINLAGYLMIYQGFAWQSALSTRCKRTKRARYVI